MGKYDGQLRIGFSIDAKHPVAKKLQDLADSSNFSVNTICKLICVDYLSKKQSGLPVITTGLDEVQTKIASQNFDLNEEDKEIQQMLANSASMGMDDVFFDEDEQEGV